VNGFSQSKENQRIDRKSVIDRHRIITYSTDLNKPGRYIFTVSDI